MLHGSNLSTHKSVTGTSRLRPHSFNHQACLIFKARQKATTVHGERALAEHPLSQRTRFTAVMSPAGISPLSCRSLATVLAIWSPASSFRGAMVM
jgi:hypothetical protein